MSSRNIQINPTPKQHLAWQKYQDKITNEILIGGGAGGGKAQPLDALLCTPFGFKTMGDVKVGDMLSHPSGCNTNVIAVHPQGKKHIYRFTFSDGATCEACAGHLWLVWFASKQSKQERKSENKGRIRTMAWLHEYLKRIADKPRKTYPIIPVTQPVQFTRGKGRQQKHATKIHPYLLGVLIGDGSLKHRPEFTSADPEIPEYIRSLGYTVNQGTRGICYGIVGQGRGRSNPTWEMIKDLGLNVGAAGKFVPHYFYTAPLEDRYALLQGLFDTDGYADSRGHLSFTSVSHQLALDVQYLVRSLGGKATITDKQGGYRLPSGERKECLTAYTVYVQIANPQLLFHLERKRQRCADYKYNGGFSEVGRRMVAVEYVGEKEAQCITVDNPDGLYITNDFIVTHNSRMICEAIASSALRYPGSRWLLGRSVLKTLKQTTLLTLFEVLTAWKLNADEHYTYNQQDSTVTFFNRSVIYLKDLAYYPSDPNYDSLGSSEYTGGAIDEANQVQAKAKEVVLSRIRYKLDDFGLVPKLLLSCNPAKNWVYGDFFKPAREGTLPPYRAFIPMLVTDNPYISPHYIASLKRLKDPALRERLLNGNWEYDDDPNALFETDALHDLFTNSIETDKQERYITCDAARLGRDKAVIMVWYGLKVMHITTYDKSRLTQIEAEIARLCQVCQVSRSHVLVDEAGVGGGIIDHLPGIKGFIGGSSPIQDTQREQDAQPGYKVNYQNLRAQCFYLLADYVREHRLAISTASQDEQEAIIEELEQIKGRDVEKDGKLKIVDKEEIKQNIGRSPDYADCLSMRTFFEIEAPAIEFSIDFF